MDTKKNTTQDQDLQRLQRRELLSLAYDLHQDLDCEGPCFCCCCCFFDEREGARSKKQERERVVRESVVRRKKINFLRENKKENKQQKNSQLEWLTLILPRPPHCPAALFRTLVHTLIHNFIQYFISSSMPCVSISPYTTFVLILPNTTSY